MFGVCLFYKHLKNRLFPKHRSYVFLKSFELLFVRLFFTCFLCLCSSFYWILSVYSGVFLRVVVICEPFTFNFVVTLFDV